MPATAVLESNLNAPIRWPSSVVTAAAANFKKNAVYRKLTSSVAAGMPIKMEAQGSIQAAL